MTKDQMKNYIYARESRSDLNLVSKNVYSTITALIIICIFVIMTVPAVHAEDTSAAESAVSDTGMEVTAALATIVYFPVKAVFSLTGGIVGGLTYWFSGGNAEATKKVWHASMEGDYTVEPENLTGEKPLNFIAPDE